MEKRIAVIGAGLVGLGWAIVFARAGCRVQVYDQNESLLAGIPDQLAGILEDLVSFDLLQDPAALTERITFCSTLADAMHEVDYVQESVLERVDVKKELYIQLDKYAGKRTIIGSSSSGIPASRFTEGLSISSRCLIAHPVNPPYLVPVVELVPAEWTAPEVVDEVHALMHSVDQHPIRVTRELEGFVLNRLQGALLREAWALYDEGYCSLEDIDATISKGLGLRWSFMGPFETIDLNAPGGVADYAHRLGSLYLELAKERTNPEPWSDSLVDRVESERRQTLPHEDLKTRTRWRDRRLMALSAHMSKQNNE